MAYIPYSNMEGFSVSHEVMKIGATYAFFSATLNFKKWSDLTHE